MGKRNDNKKTETKDLKKQHNDKKQSENKGKKADVKSSRTLTTVDYTDLSYFIAQTRKLLQDEKESEEEQMLAEGSNMTRVVEILEVHATLSGRYNVTMQIKPGGKGLVSNTFLKVGESIQLRLAEQPKESLQEEKTEGGAGKGNEDRGVVNAVTDKFIIATMNGFIDEWWEGKVLVNKVLDSVTFKRVNSCLNRLSTIMEKQTVCERILGVCFGREPPHQDPHGCDFLESDNAFYNDGLNDSQRDAIRFALNSKDVALILGPPGTGKTTTVVEAIKQIVTKRREKVLVCAPSNIAVDNIVEKLATGAAANKVRIVRMGHPARLMDSVMKHSVDYNIDHGDGFKIVQDIRKDIAEVYRKMSKTRSRADKRQFRTELRQLQKELKERERKVVQDVIDYSDVVLCTITGADDRYLRDRTFDYVIIDEAAQAIEVACWIPLMKGRKTILAGDPFQLPPTILSEKAKRGGLEVTLFERLYVKYGEQISRMLQVQYRMHEEIMQWSSKEFYDGKLIAHESVKEHLLSDLNDVDETDETVCPLIMIDTARCGMEENDYKKEDELQENDKARKEESKSNDHEARLVFKHVISLLEAGVKENQIAIITPYSAQVQTIRSLLSENYEEIEIGTVDGFQGREKEAIIISMVRSNPDGQVGFLADERRTNVAITRARRHVCVVCDTATLRTNPFLSRMSQYFTDNAIVKSANEYL
jgi:ATP-dependent RNA/DNA helicase IGHMBP2